MKPKQFPGQIALLSLLFVWTAPLFAGGPTVTVSSFPSTSYETSKWYGGTFVEMGNEINGYIANDDGSKVGYYIPIYSTPADGHGKWVDCCVDLITAGKKWVLKADEVTVDVNISGMRVGLPYWDAWSTCKNQRDEWNRFAGVVQQHEDGHVLIAKNFFKKENIEPYYTSASLDIQGSCDEEHNQEAEKGTTINRFLSVIEHIRTTISEDLGAAQDKYHETAPSSTVNVSITCP